MSSDSQSFDFEAFLRKADKSAEDVIKRCDSRLWTIGTTSFEEQGGDDAYNRFLEGGELDRILAEALREDVELLLTGPNNPRSRSLEQAFACALSRTLIFAIEEQNLSAAKYLLQQGIAPHWTHADAALKSRDTTMLKLLLDHGWKINEQCGWSTPPLLCEVVADYDMVEWFLDHGADPNARCYLDINPLSYAVSRAPFSVIERLFERGGSVHSGQLIHHAIGRIHHQPDTLEVLDYLLNKGSPINKIQYEGDYQSLPQSLFTIGTPLHGAVHCGRLDIVRFLLSRGAHPLIRDTLRLTPVQRAELQGKTELMEYLRPTSEAAEPIEPQFTDDYHAPGWERLAGKFWRQNRL